MGWGVCVCVRVGAPVSSQLHWHMTFFSRTGDCAGRNGEKRNILLTNRRGGLFFVLNFFFFLSFFSFSHLLVLGDFSVQCCALLLVWPFCHSIAFFLFWYVHLTSFGRVVCVSVDVNGCECGCLAHRLGSIFCLFHLHHPTLDVRLTIYSRNFSFSLRTIQLSAVRVSVSVQ